MSKGGNYDGKNVWITGGASGIGLAVARRLAAAGANITVFDRRLDQNTITGLDQARRMPATPVRCHMLDVADATQVERAFVAATQEGGPPDLVLNSAGVTCAIEFDRLAFEDWDRVLRINLYGSRNVAAAAGPLLAPGARLALVASLAGIAGGYGYSAYAASKFGVVGLAEVLRLEWKPRGIAVSVICPPEVDTPMVQEERKVRPRATGEMKLFAGSLSVDEAADAIVAGLIAGDYLIVPGKKARLTYWLSKYLPRSITQRVADHLVRKALANE